MFGYTPFDWFIIITCAVIGIGGLLVNRFAPTYISNRSKRYIHPKRKGVKR